MLEIKVPLIFLPTVGFSLRWDGRYTLNLLQLEEYLKGGDSGNSDSNSRDGLP
jgi:hypothetical protein